MSEREVLRDLADAAARAVTPPPLDVLRERAAVRRRGRVGAAALAVVAVLAGSGLALRDGSGQALPEPGVVRPAPTLPSVPAVVLPTAPTAPTASASAVPGLRSSFLPRASQDTAWTGPSPAAARPDVAQCASKGDTVLTVSQEVAYSGRGPTQAASLVWGTAPDAAGARTELRALRAAECAAWTDPQGITWVPTRAGTRTYPVGGVDEAVASTVRLACSGGEVRWHELLQVRRGARAASLVVQTPDRLSQAQDAAALEHLAVWLQSVPPTESAALPPTVLALLRGSAKDYVETPDGGPLSWRLADYQVQTWRSVDDFTLLVTLDLHWAGQPVGNFNEGGNDRFAHVTRRSGRSTYSISWATSP
ncbi:hypothetical protein EV189_0810 [Motilibacter rhizosphaerae]|uniref:Uncharacterized protein n=1 Tax=Motilibacter rhizosphaerae TaxID=598652 RepID=A0A4Q7NWH2_9ACTN|nr:hypothetical protein [Motilibacter rhizosphaerae]RZS91565.1 hypothetical protein EV189_0810 [Motilibacter rhizosphaerae]